MSVWALGINHNTAPLDLRGRFAFALDQIQPTLNGYRQSLARQPEATLLSTCNRTELYGAGDHASVDPTLDWLAQTGGVSSQVLRDHAYVLRDDAAAAVMLMECAPISVELRTSLATANERWNSWCSVVPRAPASLAARTASFI